MKLKQVIYQRILMICACVLLATALTIALGVIPPAKADTYPGVKPGVVVMAFGINIGLTVLSSLSILSMALKSRKRNWKSTTVLVTAGVIILVMALALLDAASAYQKHGPGMQTATILLFTCAAVDFLTAVTVIITALLRPKTSPGERN